MAWWFLGKLIDWAIIVGAVAKLLIALCWRTMHQVFLLDWLDNFMGRRWMEWAAGSSILVIALCWRTRLSLRLDGLMISWKSWWIEWLHGQFSNCWLLSVDELCWVFCLYYRHNNFMERWRIYSCHIGDCSFSTDHAILSENHFETSTFHGSAITAIGMQSS